MAAPTKEKINIDNLSDLQKTLYRDYKEDLQAHDDAIVDFDAYEAMSMGKTYDSVSRETNNGLTDSMTATIYLERAARVAGQLPEGTTQALGRKDFGKGLFMDILRTKWIYPNANAQRPFRTKMYMWQYGSSEYGYMPMYYDINVSPSGYFGPDCWLWSPRNFIPQNGETTISDMDYCHAIAYKSPKFFEDILDDESDKTWKKKAIQEVVDQIKQKLRETDPQRDTLNKRLKQKQSSRHIMIATRYEAGKDGRWISFLPEFGMKVIRNIKNPHKNSRIPFVIKACIPTFDSFYNIGDFQRSMPMQFANDGLDNFYFQGIKVSLFPNIIINTQGVIRHTIRPNEPGTVWETNGPVHDNIGRLETSPQGLSTYQAAKGMARGALQQIAGTTDTRSNADNASDPGFGKTPKALSMLDAKEATRDAQDRTTLEEAMKELVEGMVSLIPTIPTKIPLSLFDKEVEEIMAMYPDLADIFKGAKERKMLRYHVTETGNQMRLQIDPAKLGGLEYNFDIDWGSTGKKTKEEQIKAVMDYLEFLKAMPNALQQYQEQTGKVPDWEFISSEYGKLADVPFMDKIFTMAKAQPANSAGPGDGTTPAGGMDAGTASAIATAAATPPEQIAAGGMPTPPDPNAPQPPVAPVPAPAAPAPPVAPAPVEDPLVVNGVRFATLQGANEARAMLAELAGHTAPQAPAPVVVA
jgi:hypothetical protein